MNQDEFFALMEEIERRFPVASWMSHGVPVWPIARINARMETLQMTGPGASVIAPKRKSKVGARGLQVLSYAASPIFGPLRNHQDWRHEIVLPRPVDALFLGDGVSLDCIEGIWRDRYCAPLMDALEAGGHSCLLMQPNAAQRLPRGQDTFSVNWIDGWGRLLANAIPSWNVHLPAHDDFLLYLRHRGLDFVSFRRATLEKASARIAIMAHLLDAVLSMTRPKIAFVVSYYYDIGYAFDLACRRRSILSVELQHGGQDGAHEAYDRWSAVPAQGYSILPAVFWNWSKDDAAEIDAWTAHLARPWHRSLWGGHPQLASWLDDCAPQTLAFDKAIAFIKKDTRETFDILVALQDLEKYGAVWDSLADFISASPVPWRWWLRRHPSPAYNSGASMRKLLSLDRPNIVIEEASMLPLPALLRNVDAVLCLMSSTAVEASYFGQCPIFLTQDARGLFPRLIESGKAEVITDMAALESRLQEIEAGGRKRQRDYDPPSLPDTMVKLFDLAHDYKNMGAGSS